jgi:hypothetical protein
MLVGTWYSESGDKAFTFEKSGSFYDFDEEASGTYAIYEDVLEMSYSDDYGMVEKETLSWSEDGDGYDNWYVTKDSLIIAGDSFTKK